MCSKATEDSPLLVWVQFWETYDHQKDLRDRVYSLACLNKSGEEVYHSLSKQHTQRIVGDAGHTPSGPDYHTPQHSSGVCQELVPLIAIHVVALPIHNLAGKPNRIARSAWHHDK